MAILSLLAKLGLDKTGFDAGMSAAGKSVLGFGKQMAGAFSAAAVSAAIAQATRAAIRYADEMKDLADTTGTSTDNAQAWNFAARLSGQNAEFVAASFTKMENALNKANLGDAATIRSLNALGVSLKDIQELSVEGAMRKASAAILKSGSDAQKNAASFDIFGKSVDKVRLMLGDLDSSKGVSHLFPTDEELSKLKRVADELAAIKVQLAAMSVGPLTKLLEFIQIGGETGGGALNRVGAIVEKNLKGLVGKGVEALFPSKNNPVTVAGFRKMERMNKLETELAKIKEQAEDKGLTTAQLREKYLARMGRVKDELQNLEGPGPAADPEIILQKRIELLHLQSKLPLGDALKQTNHPFHVESTKLGSIGGGLGNTGAVRTEQIASESLRIQKAMLEQLARRGIVVANWR